MEDPDNNNGWTIVPRRRRWHDPFDPQWRPWDKLPSLALVNIFCKTDFKDRWTAIPLVCRSWRLALEHPNCWSSMLPDTVSPKDAFIKEPHFIPTEVEFHQQNFKTLIKRSGAGSVITSLHLKPFVSVSRFCSDDFHWVRNWTLVGRHPIERQRKRLVQKRQRQRYIQKTRRRERRWDELPSLALVKIFCRTDFKDRWKTIPVVCRSWRSALDHPDCWSSMIPESVSPEDAFIKKSCFFPTEWQFHQQNFKTLIKRSGGGFSITTLYLRPFISAFRNCSYDYDWVTEDNWYENDDYVNNEYKKMYHATESEVLRLVANSCPNLKHISFHGFQFRHAIMKDELLEIFKRCKKLDLVDFSCSKEMDSPVVIKEMGNHLSQLRGVRILGWRNYDVADCISTYLPRLQLLNLDVTSTLPVPRSKDCFVSTILSTCVNLHYLSASGVWEGWYENNDKAILDKEIADQATDLIPEFYCCAYSYPGAWSCRTCWRYEECHESDEKTDEKGGEAWDGYGLYANEYYLFKYERKVAFVQDRAMNRRRRQFRFLNAYGSKRKFGLRRSKCKPLVEYNLPYASDTYVMPLYAKDK